MNRLFPNSTSKKTNFVVTNKWRNPNTSIINLGLHGTFCWRRCFKRNRILILISKFRLSRVHWMYPGANLCSPVELWDIPYIQDEMCAHPKKISPQKVKFMPNGERFMLAIEILRVELMRWKTRFYALGYFTSANLTHR